jgi:hypothetical protein
MRKRLAKIGLLLLNALVPVFIAACYGTQELCLSGRVVDKATGKGINGIRVSCLFSNGPSEFSLDDDVTAPLEAGDQGVCGGYGDTDTDVDTDIDIDIDDDTDVDSDSDSDTDSETDTDSEIDTDSETETGSDTDVDTDADVDAGSGDAGTPGDAGTQTDAGAQIDGGATLLWEAYSMPLDGYFEIRLDTTNTDLWCQMLRFTDVDGEVNGSYKELTLWHGDFDDIVELEPVE